MLLGIRLHRFVRAFHAALIRTQNRFAWSAMREITILFFAIFVDYRAGLSLLQSRRP